MDLKAFRERFQPLFEGFLSEKCSTDAAMAEDAFLEKIIRYPELLAAGEGKRVRPYMAWLMYGAVGGEDRGEVMRILVALELFHVFALIHDDVMDRGTTRHGVPTVHLAVEEMLQRDNRLGDAARTGEAQAILLGDLMFQWSQEVFSAASDVPSVARNRAATYFRKMIEEVIVGQMIDVDLATRPSATPELINRKMHLKTSSYTFIRPLQIGAALGSDMTKVNEDWCVVFGTALGRAFQTQDDLLDLTVSAAGTGKTAFSDLQERQHTLFTQHIMEQGTDAQKAELASLLGTTLSEADRPRVMALFESSGALAFGRSEISRSFEESGRILDASPMSDAAREPFRAFINGMKERTA